MYRHSVRAVLAILLVLALLAGCGPSPDASSSSDSVSGSATAPASSAPAPVQTETLAALLLELVDNDRLTFTAALPLTDQHPEGDADNTLYTPNTDGIRLLLDRIEVEVDSLEMVEALPEDLLGGVFIRLHLWDESAEEGIRPVDLRLLEDGRIYYAYADAATTDTRWQSARMTADCLWTVGDCILLTSLPPQNNQTGILAGGLSLNLNAFPPTSTHLRIGGNLHEADITLSPADIRIDRLEDGWQPCGITLEDTEPVVLEADSWAIYGFPLDAVTGGKETGFYRVQIPYTTDGGSDVSLCYYCVTEDADTASLAPSPSMTPEVQALCEKYFYPWNYLTIFKQDFSETQPLEDVAIPYIFYSTCMQLAGLDPDSYWDDLRMSAHVPAALVDEVVTRYLPVTVETFRKNLPTKPSIHGEAYSNYYNATEGYYNFPGGYGGGGVPHPVVLSVEREGDLLTFLVRWYSIYDEPVFEHRTVIRQGETPEDFRYLASEVLEWYTEPN